MQRAALFFASTLCASAATNFFDYDVEDVDDDARVMRILLDTDLNMHHTTDAMNLAGYGSQIVEVEGNGVFMGGSGDAFVGSSFTDGPDGPVPGHSGHSDGDDHGAHMNGGGFEGSSDDFEGSAVVVVTPVDHSIHSDDPRVDHSQHTHDDHPSDGHDDHATHTAFEGSADTFEGSADDLSGDGDAQEETVDVDVDHSEPHTGSVLEASPVSIGDWDHEYSTGSAELFEAGSGAAVVFEGDGDHFSGSSDTHLMDTQAPEFEGSGAGADFVLESS